MKKYLRYWFSYCYYRYVDWYEQSIYSADKYYVGSHPFAVTAFCVLAILIALFGGSEKEKLTNLLFSTPSYIINICLAIILLPRYFNEKRYHKMKIIFVNESQGKRIIMGLLVYATVLGPVFGCIILALCHCLS